MTIAKAAFYSALTVCSVLLLKVFRKHALRRGLPLPPGPTGFPIIGNVLDIDIVSPWLSYEEWGKRYGEHCVLDVWWSLLVKLCRWSCLRQLTRPRLRHH